MSSIEELGKIVSERDALVAWWSNRENRDSQSGNAYSLRIDTQLPKAMYCGQARAGGNNYHDAPDAFNKAMKDDIDRVVKVRASEVYAGLVAQYNDRIRAISDDVRAELDAIDATVQNK